VFGSFAVARFTIFFLFGTHLNKAEDVDVCRELRKEFEGSSALAAMF
jgi:hypothetical protein